MTVIAYLVSDYFAPSHTFVRREVKALQKMGARVVAFSIQPSNSAASDVQCILGRSLLDYSVALLWALATRPSNFFSTWGLALRHRPPGIRGLIWSQFHFIEAIMLARLLEREKCTRLHNHFANSAATVGMIAAHFLRISWSLTLHGISETDFPAGMLLGEKLQRAEFVACASYFMRAQAMRMAGFDHWSKMHIVRCGIDHSTLPHLIDNKIAEHDDTVALICVGRLSAEKGYFGFLDSLARLAEHNLKFSLTIIGDGPSSVEIHARVTVLGLTDRVRFLGALPEAETLAEIARADVLVLPSLMEGLPVVLIEALALGKPVVAARVAGVPELIDEGKTGLMFTPSDWTDLERQMRKILQDQSLRQLLSTNGTAKVFAEFTSYEAACIMSSLLQGRSTP